MKRVPAPISLLLIISVTMMSFTDPPVHARVKTTETILSSREAVEKVTLTYDSIGRLTGYATDLNPTYGYKIDYDHDTVTYIFPRDPKRLMRYVLNAHGRIVTDQDNAIYTYDENGFFTGKTSGPDNVQKVTISGGDVASFYYKRNDVSGTTTYTYYPELDYRDFGSNYEGRAPGHLVREQTTERNGASTTTRYAYTFDTLGRVRTETFTMSRPGHPDIISITSYTYTD